MPAIIHYPPRAIPEIGDVPSVFLAGTIEMGDSFDWQAEATKRLADRACHVFNPRRQDWDASWDQTAQNAQFSTQVNWELDRLEEADLVLMHFEPASKSPITLLELGMFARQKRHNLVISCPAEFWRRGNVEIVAQRTGAKLYNGFEPALACLLEQLDAITVCRAESGATPLY